MTKTVVFDFDGVIHSYTSGWYGETVISDPPVRGIKEAIDEIRAAGYKVIVVSTRCAKHDGILAVRAWLSDNGIEVDDVMADKPPAVVYIDDRAICFDGHPEILLAKIMSFKPWNQIKGSGMEEINFCFNNKQKMKSLNDWELAKLLRCPFGVHRNTCTRPYSCQTCTYEWLQQSPEDIG